MKIEYGIVILGSIINVRVRQKILMNILYFPFHWVCSPLLYTSLLMLNFYKLKNVEATSFIFVTSTFIIERF